MKTEPAIVGRLSNKRNACVSNLGVIVSPDGFQLTRSELRNLADLYAEFVRAEEEAAEASPHPAQSNGSGADGIAATEATFTHTEALS